MEVKPQQTCRYFHLQSIIQSSNGMTLALYDFLDKSTLAVTYHFISYHVLKDVGLSASVLFLALPTLPLELHVLCIPFSPLLKHQLSS